MKDPFPNKRTIFSYTIMHTAAVILLLISLLAGKRLTDKTLFVILAALYSIGSSFFTASIICKNVKEYDIRIDSYTKASEKIRKASAVLAEYAKSLENEMAAVVKYVNERSGEPAAVNMPQRDRVAD